MIALGPLAAANADFGFVIRIIIVILIVVVPAIGRILASLRQPSAPGERRPEAPRDPNAQTEIDEFLRRVSTRRGQGAPAPVRMAPPPARREVAVAAEVVEDADEPVGAQVEKHVEKYLDSTEFGRRSARMGGEVAQSDAEMGQHFQQVFSHDVSKLAKKPGEAALPPEATRDEVATVSTLLPPPNFGLLLGNLDALRQAIILNEILQPPEHRWE
jgi:hypothetical protein